MHANTADNPVQVIDVVSMTYARSLMALAAPAGSEAEVGDELNQLAELYAAEPQLAALFRNRSISSTAKAASLQRMLQGKVSELTYNFVQVVNAKDRLVLLPAMAAAFGQLLKERRGEVDVEVTSARPLSATQLDAVRTQIAGAVGGTPVITPRVDESILGGLKLKIGSKLIDGSVATQLDRIKHDLVAKGREAARANASALLEE